MSDLGYGHDDISCMIYDIHVDILLGCVDVYGSHRHGVATGARPTRSSSARHAHDNA